MLMGEIRVATKRDIRGAAKIYCTAFAESNKLYFGDVHPILAVEDAFNLFLDSQINHFFVLVNEDRVEGYIIAPNSIRAVIRHAFLSGRIFKMTWKWLCGRYGFSISMAMITVIDTMHNLFTQDSKSMTCDSRILSIAVDPSAQGKGYGSQLLEIGLNALKRSGAKRVRLEVKQDNEPAIALYEKHGFKIHGTSLDRQGYWTIMIKEFT
jgi:ribosomal-protein-alanine N-acetyltransferase